MNINLVRAITFNCAHLYEVKEWTHDENLKEFGLCFSKQGHGHTYTLEASVEGPIDPTTGMILNLRDLDQILKESVFHLQGKHLNTEVEAFKSVQPTTENIAKYLNELILKKLTTHSVHLAKIRLYETKDLWVECIN